MTGLKDLSWKELAEKLLELETHTGGQGSHEAARLVHDLHVHQLELEMQNRELREAQAELESSRARYAELYDQAPVGYATLDGAGRILEINLTAARIIGRPREQLVGFPFGALDLADRAAFHAHLQQAAATRATTIGDAKVRTGKGELTLQLATSARPADDRPVGFHTILTDVTELRRTQRQAAELEHERSARESADSANQMKDQFLGIVSHELRTPLTALLGWTQMLAVRPGDAGLVARGAEVMKRSGESLVRIVDDLLDVSRVVSGKLHLESKLVDFADLMRLAVESARPVAAAKRITIAQSIDGGCYVRGDPTRLQQVVSNVLSNALKFTREGGHVWVSLLRDRGDLRLEVRDDGVGIDAVEIPKLFHKFHQADRTSRRSFGGLGLGLAIARTLVDAHAGSIEARSPGIGQGASFVVKLPLAAPTDSTRKPAVESGDPLAPNGKIAGVKVLYVDDDPYMLELVSIMLGERGAVVRTAASVNEAMVILTSFTPDVLVSDIAMADRDGYDLVREVRAMPAPISTIPIIAMTAHARLDEVKDALEAGFS
ncbi:MAG: ATP-binding protein, partial [Myxococcota bacterium]|nr:ATP-binding protein [Myxococcota bacterium]